MKAILSISAKCSDLCWMQLDYDKDKEIDHSGYVPDGLGIGGGDYIDFEVDIETGQIQNWKPLTAKKVVEILKED